MNLIKINKYKGYLKVWAEPISLLIFLFLFGAFGYRITEGWDWGDCLWMVLITITTIGFGEVEVLSSAGRVITFLIIGGGLFVVQLTLQRFIQLSELGYFIKLEQLRLRRLIRRMKNHVIICGYGRTGKEIADQLINEKISTIIIESDSSRKIEAEEKGFNVLLADATMDETLLLAGVKNCRSLVVTLPSDAANLYVVLSAKALNNTCRLIARAANEEAANKLKLAGADAVVSPYVAAGRTMAASALRPIAVDFIDLLAGSDCEIEEFKLTDNVDKIEIFNSQNENIYNFSKSGEALLLATKVSGQLMGNPKDKVSISPGMILIFLGSQEQLNKIRVDLKDVLVNLNK
ncbi:potassium channel family protein [Prochlorococcus marinus]|uniref:potassium channel family protein n=1 Tax=Prochlorococcus marinus TaxID=1219 RepID=UPI0022B3449E|nr:potassium channel family protein [Prochlorococcus marinus]